MTSGGNNFNDFPENQSAILRVYDKFYSTSWFAGTLQYQRSGCGRQYLPEHRSGSKIFARTVLRRVPAPLHPCSRDGQVFL